MSPPSTRKRKTDKSKNTSPALLNEQSLFQISVVIPVKGHPVLIDDAILSVRHEMDQGNISRLIIVNDGCEFAETIDTLNAWQALLGDKIRVLHYPNGGLSTARNRGIEAALKFDPQLDAIFLLDADNTLAEGAGHAMQALLNTRPNADWFYPDFDFFGQNGHYVTDHNSSLLFHARINLCEAGSLIRRRIFDAGLRFDASMNKGYEDWEFWLSAMKKGFRGEPAARPLLLYRKRPVSMLSNSHDIDGDLRRYMREKHHWLFNVPHLLELEAQRFARFAVIEGNTVQLMTDPDHAETITLAELERRLMAHWAEPFANHAPTYLICLREGVSERLRRNGLMRSFLWNSERRWVRSTNRPEMDLFFLSTSSSGHHIRTDAGNPDVAPDGVTLDLAAVRWIVFDTSPEHLRRIDHVPSQLHVNTWSMELENTRPLNPLEPAASELLRGFLLKLTRSRFLSSVSQRWEWREKGGAVDRAAAVDIPRDIADGGVVFPLLKHENKNDIAFVLPIFDFGGVEKVAASMAREMAKQGWRCHLFVISDRPIHSDGWALAAFETVNWLPDATALDWSGPEFMGTAEPRWGTPEERGDLIGLLSSMNVVINAHSGAMHKATDALRRRGIIMIDHEHLLERSLYGRGYGPPRLALAYENAYDLFITCSEAMRAWLHGNGIPREKLLAVVNAPGYPMQQIEVQRVAKARNLRKEMRPLNVLFMGRLDAQKGVHRLSAIFNTLDHVIPDIRMTVAGGSIVDQNMTDLHFPEKTRELGPIRGVEELTQVLSDADIMILPSLYEGLPLSLLEAQRCGVVVIACDVGAVDEAIVDGTTGFILPEEGCEESFVRQIMALNADRTLLRKISQQAVETKRDWSQVIIPLTTWLKKRQEAEQSLSLECKKRFSKKEYHVDNAL